MSETGQIYGLIPKIMGEVGAIEKSRRNQTQGYSFRGIDDVYAALQGPLTKHGVFYVPEVLKREREERQTQKGGTLIYTMMDVAFTFFAPDGSNFRAVTTGEAMDSGDKSANKAMSAALKYALLQVFCIPTEEPKDTENDDPKPLPANGKPPPRQQAKQQEPSAANADPLVDDKSASQLLIGAFVERGSTPEDATAAIKAILSKRKKSLKDLPAKERAVFLKSIQDGKLDSYKPKPAK